LGFVLKLELSDFAGKPCNSRLAYEFVPSKSHELDLSQVAKTLHANGVFIEIETPALIMLKIAGKDVSLFRSGKIIVKSTNEQSAARAVAQKLISKMG